MAVHKIDGHTVNVGDRVRVKATTDVFAGQVGTVAAGMVPDYDWTVLLDGTDDPTDTYGFNADELEPAP